MKKTTENVSEQEARRREIQAFDEVTDELIRRMLAGAPDISGGAADDPSYDYDLEVRQEPFVLRETLLYGDLAMVEVMRRIGARLIPSGASVTEDESYLVESAALDRTHVIGTKKLRKLLHDHTRKAVMLPCPYGSGDVFYAVLDRRLLLDSSEVVRV